MMTDRQFAKSFFKMIFFLALLTITLIVAGIVIGGSIDDKLRAQSEEFTQRIIAQRTQPVGTLNVGAMEPSVEPTSVEPTTPVQVASSGNVGKSVYDKACFICHTTGITGAPKPGDADNWAPRIAKGLDTLYSNAIKGFQGETGIMPPKGGNLLLSNEDVIAAVDYLVDLVQ